MGWDAFGLPAEIQPFNLLHTHKIDTVKHKKYEKPIKETQLDLVEIKN